MHIKKKGLLVVFIFCISTCFAQSATMDPIDIEYKECLSKDTSTSNLYICAFETYAKWDKQMDREYKKLQKKIKREKDKKALVQAQNAWVSFRDFEFKSYDNMFNQPGYNWVLQRANGRIDLVRARTMQLKAYNDAFDKKRK